MARKRGLYLDIARQMAGGNLEKLEEIYNSLRRELAKQAMEVAKRVYNDVVKIATANVKSPLLVHTIEKHPGEAWFYILEKVLPAYWDVVHRDLSLLTQNQIDEIVRRIESNTTLMQELANALSSKLAVSGTAPTTGITIGTGAGLGA